MTALMLSSGQIALQNELNSASVISSTSAAKSNPQAKSIPEASADGEDLPVWPLAVTPSHQALFLAVNCSRALNISLQDKKYEAQAHT